jgi:4a-hydroxytetrahydrobiopterin dehydratase
VQGWNNVTVEVWTHSRNGLSENDFILAAKIDNISKDDLLSKKQPEMEALT